MVPAVALPSAYAPPRKASSWRRHLPKGYGKVKAGVDAKIENGVRRWYFPAWEIAMRTTIDIDEELLADAQEFSGIKGRSAVIHEALRWFVAREAGRRIARLGGSEPGLQYIPRRRPPDWTSD